VRSVFRVAIIASRAAPLQLSVSSGARAAMPVDRGKLLVQQNCARCHAIGATGSSPYAPAPPFRTLHERYDVEDLAEARTVATSRCRSSCFNPIRLMI
jgi:cytochrome c